MPYSDSLAQRIRHALRGRRGVVEKKMFGGVGFMLHGHLCVGIWKDSLITRLEKDDAKAALDEPHVKPFDITGKPMAGWLLVEAAGLESDAELGPWLERSIDYVKTLPKK
jgi:hypothetical protein